MKFFVDSADLSEVREAVSWGLADGVTTNPSLLAKTGRPYAEVLREICAAIDGPVSAEVVATEAAAMCEEGQKLAQIHPNVVVKCPLTIDGLKATKALSARGIRVNVTLVFSPLQGLAAAKCGATYVSPFVGRLDDLGHDGFAMVEQLVRILRNYAYPSQVLVASLRSPNHVLRAAETGAQVATVPFNVMRQMLEHPLTAIGLERFLADWHKTKQKI
ncbi:MAG TPA: fructose-6-phosphate aldolase [Candidatus Binataceae bacterium]|jgi:transaldolase|nr:fructose-6-phosphate aldolase [Candidatus Binataceae bacterium]